MGYRGERPLVLPGSEASGELEVKAWIVDLMVLTTHHGDRFTHSAALIAVAEFAGANVPFFVVAGLGVPGHT